MVCPRWSCSRLGVQDGSDGSQGVIRRWGLGKSEAFKRWGLKEVGPLNGGT